MRAFGFIKTLVLIAALVTPLLATAAASAESGAHRGGPPSGDIRSPR